MPTAAGASNGFGSSSADGALVQGSASGCWDARAEDRPRHRVIDPGGQRRAGSRGRCARVAASMLMRQSPACRRRGRRERCAPVTDLVAPGALPMAQSRPRPSPARRSARSISRRRTRRCLGRRFTRVASRPRVLVDDELVGVPRFVPDAEERRTPILSEPDELVLVGLAHRIPFSLRPATTGHREGKKVDFRPGDPVAYRRSGRTSVGECRGLGWNRALSRARCVLHRSEVRRGRP